MHPAGRELVAGRAVRGQRTQGQLERGVGVAGVVRGVGRGLEHAGVTLGWELLQQGQHAAVVRVGLPVRRCRRRTVRGEERLLGEERQVADRLGVVDDARRIGAGGDERLGDPAVERVAAGGGNVVKHGTACELVAEPHGALVEHDDAATLGWFELGHPIGAEHVE